MKPQPGRTTLSVSTPLLCLTLLIPAICSGCGEPPPLDMSLLTGEPCEPPCWQRLTPGVSTQEDLSDYVAGSNYVAHHYREAHAVGTTIWWQSTLDGRGMDTRSFFATRYGTLSVMMIYLDYEVTLEDLLAKYGPPEKVRADWSSGGSAVALVNLYYPTQGFMLQLEVIPSDGYHEVLPQTKAVRVWYFVPAPLEALPKLRFFIPFPAREHMGTELRDWPGYGPIELD